MADDFAEAKQFTLQELKFVHIFNFMKGKMLPIVSNMIEAHIFRIKKNKIEFLLLKRSENEIYPGLWQMVSGSIHEDETAYQTALREIIEETKLIPKKMWVVPNINSFYSSEKNCISILPVFAAQVKFNSKVILSEEHTESVWVTKEKAKKMLAWVGQKKSVDVITDYFTQKKSFLKFVEIKISQHLDELTFLYVY